MFGGQVAGQALVAAGTHGRRRPRASTRCTPTSCGRATRAARSSTRSTASGTAGRSPPGGWWRSSTAGRSSTSRRRSTSTRTGSTTSSRCRPTSPTPRRSPTSATAMAPVEGRAGRLVRPPPPHRHPPRRLDARRPQGPQPPDHRVWLRADGTLPDDPVLHACVVTYASDMTLLDTTLRPSRRQQHRWDACRWPASITPCGSTGRSGPTTGCCTTRTRRRPRRRGAWLAASIFTRRGELAVSVVQEGLIRRSR